MIRWIPIVAGTLGLAAATGLLGDEDSGRIERLTHHPGGAPREQSVFVDGVRHGPVTRWYPDGTLRAEGEFVQGQMEGSWSWYLPDGRPDSERSGHYRDGRRSEP